MSGTDSAGERGRSRDAAQEWAEFERLLAAESSRPTKPGELSTLEADALSEAATQPAAAVASVPGTRSSTAVPARDRPYHDAVYGATGNREARKRHWRRRFGLDAWWRGSPNIWVVAALAFVLGFAASRALQGPAGVPRAAVAGTAREAPRGTNQTEPSEDQATPALKLDRDPAALVPQAARPVTGSARKR